MKKLFEYYPEIAKEWHPTKNLPIILEKISCGSKRNIWWVCKCGQEYQARPQSRTSRGYGCPYCGRKKKIGSLDLTHPVLVNEWHPKNKLTPKDVTGGSHEKIWWLGKCGHEWCASVHNRAKNYKPSNCPFCCNRLVDNNNCLELCFPEIALEWHPTKNGEFSPSQVTHRAYKRVWWLGKCGHEWESLVRCRTRKIRPTGCPFCQESKGEVAIGKILNHLNIQYETQVRFVSCKDKKPLPFDFMIIGRKFLIEYQGLQHYEPVNFGGNYKEQFLGIKRRDEIKRKWCCQKEYDLLIIPYWELCNAKEIIERKVCYSTQN